jgi:hypothetical protein
VLKKLEKAKSIREEAEKQASEIESGILKELKAERKKLLAQVAQIDGEIERISGKPVATGEGKKRIDTEQTILEIVKELGKASCLTIESHPKMIALYAENKREVSPQAAKLKSLVKAKQLVKHGERKKAVYSLP